MNRNDQNGDSERPTSEKLWDATRKTFHTATFRAQQYKRVVQKKIDLNAIHKKIAGCHSDLGKLIDDARSRGEEGILEKDEIQDLFHKLDGLKHAAATLEEELEAIKREEPEAEDEAEPAKQEDEGGEQEGHRE